MNHFFVRLFRSHWEYALLALTLLALGLFLLGYDLLGLNNTIATLLALAGTPVVAVLSFLMASLILPLIALALGLASAVLALLMSLAAFLVGGLITPVAAFFTGIATSLISWIAGTWLGTLLSPLYSLIAPLMLKIGPWLTLTTYGRKFYDWLDDQPWFPQSLVLTGNRQTAQAAAKGRGKATPAATRRAQSK